MKNLGGKMNFNFRKGKSGVIKTLQGVMQKVRYIYIYNDFWCYHTIFTVGPVFNYKDTKN